MKKIAILLACMTLSLSSCNSEKITENDNSFIITPQNEYYIHYQDMYIEITPDTYITRNKMLKDYLKPDFLFIRSPFANSHLISDLSKYFAYDLKGVIEVDYTGKSVAMPLIDVNNKKVIDTVNLTKIIEEKIGSVQVNNEEISSDIVKNNDEIKNVNLSGMNIHILNANGTNGIAKQLGDKLHDSLGVNFNAENYDKKEEYSYIILGSLSEDEALKLALTTGIKNLKIKENDTNNEYAASIILGDNKKYNVELVSPAQTSELKVLLNDYSVSTKNSDKYNDKKIDDNLITVYYNKEDLYIAKQIEGKLVRTKLVEDNTIKNKIVITSNR